jgi:hypothetical protein
LVWNRRIDDAWPCLPHHAAVHGLDSRHSTCTVTASIISFDFVPVTGLAKTELYESNLTYMEGHLGSKDACRRSGC